nr:hypothetical protein [uncultured Anaeromusa sp.]
MRKIKRALRKKAAAVMALALAALLLTPQAVWAGETRTYTGSETMQIFPGGALFSPENLANVTGNTLIINYASGMNPDCVFGAYTSLDASYNSVFLLQGHVNVYVEGGVSDDGSAIGNSVIMSGGSVGGAVIGGWSNKGSAIGNSVTINGGSVGAEIYGGYTYCGIATQNTVTISGNPILTNSILYGGFKAGAASDAWTGNTMNVKNSGMSARGVVNFQYYNFYLPVTFAAGGTMLGITNGANLANSTIGISFLSSGATLQSGDRVTLLQSGGALATGGINTTATGFSGIAKVYDFILSSNTNNLYATVSSTRQNPQTKALSEGQASTAAFLNQGADMLTGQGLQNARGASSGSGGQCGVWRQQPAL